MRMLVARDLIKDAPKWFAIYQNVVSLIDSKLDCISSRSCFGLLLECSGVCNGHFDVIHELNWCAKFSNHSHSNLKQFGGLLCFSIINSPRPIRSSTSNRHGLLWAQINSQISKSAPTLMGFPSAYGRVGGIARKQRSGSARDELY